MRNTLLASTTALLVGITFASAQNMPSGGQPGSAAQSDRGSAGADRQQQGRDAQRGAEEQTKRPGAQDKRPGAQDKQGQSERSEGKQQRDQTTGQASGRKEEQGKQDQRDQSMQGQSKPGQRDQRPQGQGKQSDSKQRGETQRDQTTGQGQREQSQGPAPSQRGQRDQTQGQAPQRQQSQPDQAKQGQPQPSSPPQGQAQPSQPQQSQPNQAQQGQAQPNQAQQGQAQQGQAQPNQAQPNQAQPNQAQPNQAQQGQAGGNVTLSSDQRTKIQQTVLAGSNVPRINNVNFALNVGVAVPTTVRVVDVPPTLIEIYPQWRGHQYFVVRDDIVIVDRSRQIVATVPVGSSGGGGAQLNNTGRGPQVGSAGGAMNLGQDEIRQVQNALKEKGFYRGQPDGVLGPQTTEALITFQRQQGFQPNGRIDTQTVTALGMSNLSGQQGNQGGSQPSTTGQSGNTMQQAPANQNTGAGQQGNQGGSQPSTTGQSGNTMQQPPSNQDAGSGQTGTSNQPPTPNPQNNNPNSGSK
jgi:putative peptidoglycan binding protein/uncharacterized protein DUF1236